MDKQNMIEYLIELEENNTYLSKDDQITRLKEQLVMQNWNITTLWDKSLLLDNQLRKEKERADNLAVDNVKPKLTIKIEAFETFIEVLTGVVQQLKKEREATQTTKETS